MIYDINSLKDPFIRGHHLQGHPAVRRDKKGVLAIRSGLEGRPNMAGNLLDREPNIRGQETLAMQGNFTLRTPVGNIESNATS